MGQTNSKPCSLPAKRQAHNRNHQKHANTRNPNDQFPPKFNVPPPPSSDHESFAQILADSQERLKQKLAYQTSPTKVPRSQTPDLTGSNILNNDSSSFCSSSSSSSSRSSKLTDSVVPRMQHQTQIGQHKVSTSSTPLWRSTPPSSPGHHSNPKLTKISASKSFSSLSLDSFKLPHRRARTHHQDIPKNTANSLMNLHDQVSHSQSTANLSPSVPKTSKYLKLKKLAEPEPSADDSISLPQNVKQELHVEYDKDLNKFRGVPHIWHNQFRPYGFTDECLDHLESPEDHLAPLPPFSIENKIHKSESVPASFFKTHKMTDEVEFANDEQMEDPRFDNYNAELYQINMAFNTPAVPGMSSKQRKSPSYTQLNQQKNKSDLSTILPRTSKQPSSSQHVPHTRSRLSKESSLPDISKLQHSSQHVPHTRSRLSKEYSLPDDISKLPPSSQRVPYTRSRLSKESSLPEIPKTPISIRDVSKYIPELSTSEYDSIMTTQFIHTPAGHKGNPKLHTRARTTDASDQMKFQYTSKHVPRIPIESSPALPKHGYISNRRPSSPAVLRTPLVPIAPRPPTSLSSLSRPITPQPADHCYDPVESLPLTIIESLDRVPPIPAIPNSVLSLVNASNASHNGPNQPISPPPAGEHQSLWSAKTSSIIPRALSSSSITLKEEDENVESPTIHPLLITMIESQTFQASGTSSSSSTTTKGGAYHNSHWVPIGAGHVQSSMITLTDILAEATSSQKASSCDGTGVSMDDMTDDGDPTVLFIDRQAYAESSRGTVYSAQDATVSNAKVVIKTVPIDDQWVLNELIIMRQARHKYIVPYIGAWLDSERTSLWLVSEMYSNGSLADLLTQCSGNLPLRSAIQSRPVMASIVAPVLSALEYLHTRLNVVYGDLRSDHILLTNDGQIGLAPHWRSALPLGTPFTSSTDQPVYWMPPDLAEWMIHGKRTDKVYVSARIDLWALAIMMIEIVSFGTYPDSDVDPSDVLEQLMDHGPPKDVLVQQYRSKKPDPLIMDLFDACTMHDNVTTKSVLQHALIKDHDFERARGHLLQIVFLAK